MSGGLLKETKLSTTALSGEPRYVQQEKWCWCRFFFSRFPPVPKSPLGLYFPLCTGLPSFSDKCLRMSNDYINVSFFLQISIQLLLILLINCWNYLNSRFVCLFLYWICFENISVGVCCLVFPQYGQMFTFAFSLSGHSLHELSSYFLRHITSFALLAGVVRMLNFSAVFCSAKLKSKSGSAEGIGTCHSKKRVFCRGEYLFSINFVVCSDFFSSLRLCCLLYNIQRFFTYLFDFPRIR